MPISLWQRLLAGEVQGIDALKSDLDESLRDRTRVAYHASAEDRFLIFIKTKGSYFCSVWGLVIFPLPSFPQCGKKPQMNRQSNRLLRHPN